MQTGSSDFWDRISLVHWIPKELCFMYIWNTPPTYTHTHACAHMHTPLCRSELKTKLKEGMSPKWAFLIWTMVQKNISPLTEMQSFHNHLTDWKRPPVRGSKAPDLTWSCGRRRWGSLTKAGRRSLLWAEEEWDGQRQENRQTVGRAAGRSQPSLCEDILRPGWEQRLTSTASLHLSG